ncbi:hypothetical protein RFN57_20085 [Streptomyces violaceochromogenes]|uniref:Uncharacterized protein n=1 Tax=Streptomyces violaceochromogenes TaxID=67377 RepID=A0ABU6LYH0_9ACTN|nr:hypothetical protein [Streptomyces violaceochromogenes]MEC7054568.1 hypothetical protein [Streptomyces violaceochromogenes]GHC77749.1 hypothetical protein GCM10010309_51040 [Streptomyces violaceochromogenes]
MWSIRRSAAGSELTRLTSDRFEKSLWVVINSVIFRSSGRDLIAAGTYIEMASRLSEPVLFGLGILAVPSPVNGSQDGRRVLRRALTA